MTLIASRRLWWTTVVLLVVGLGVSLVIKSQTGALVAASEIPSFYHIDRQGNPEWTRDISHLEV